MGGSAGKGPESFAFFHSKEEFGEVVAWSGLVDGVFPEVLHVRSPNNMSFCGGHFHIVKSQLRNGHPMWLRAANPSLRGAAGANMWLYSSIVGTWNIGGCKASKENFRCHFAHIFSRERHNGRAPHLMRGLWWRQDNGEMFVSDPEITVTCPLKCLPCGQKHDVIDDFENLEDDADDAEEERLHVEAKASLPLAATPGASWERAPAMQKLMAKSPSESNCGRRSGSKTLEREGNSQKPPRSHSAEPLKSTCSTPLLDLGALLRSRLSQAKATTAASPREPATVIWSQLAPHSEEAEQALPTLQQPPPAKRERIARPLEMEFLDPRRQQEKVLRCIFTTQPIGITFVTNTLTVKTVSGGGTAHVQGVRRGMELVRLMGIDVTKSSMNQNDILNLVEDWCARLPDDQVHERAQCRSLAM